MQLENNFMCSVPELQEVTDVKGKQSHNPGEDALCYIIKKPLCIIQHSPEVTVLMPPLLRLNFRKQPEFK